MKYLFIVLLLLSSTAMAQRSDVNATVQSPDGALWPNCKGSASLVETNPVVGQGPSLTDGSSFQKQVNFNCDSFGRFTTTVTDNSFVVPTGTQWKFSICSAPGYPTGAYCFSWQQAINGTPVDLTAALKAVAPQIVLANGAGVFVSVVSDPVCLGLGLNKVCLTALTPSAPHTVTIPNDIDGHIPLLERNNTWTALQSFAALTSSAIQGPIGTITPNTGLFTSVNGIPCAALYPGADAGAKINAAILALPATGGIVDARCFSPTETIGTSITINRPVSLLLGCTAFTATVTPAFSITSEFMVQGTNRYCSSITAASGGTIFGTGVTSYNVRQLYFSDLRLIGNGVGSALVTPDYVGGGINFNNTRITVQRSEIKTFGDYAVKLGESTFLVNLDHNEFRSNAGAIQAGYGADFKVDDNLFISGTGANPNIQVVGGSIVQILNNAFVAMAGTGADIELNPTVGAGRGGQVKIAFNKFGPESEQSGRYKIRAYNATATRNSTNVSIDDNDLGCLVTGGQAAIRLDNGPYIWGIINNTFSDCQALVDDAATIVNAPRGRSVFMHNRYYNSGLLTTGWTVFTNGGHSFDTFEPPAGGSADRFLPADNSRDTPELRNRVPFSELLSSWGGGIGIVYTCAQADPWGSTSACKLTKDATANLNSSAVLNATGMRSQVYISFWAKSGSLSQATVGLMDTTLSAFVNLNFYALRSTWQRYKTVVNGINPADAFTLYVYPDNNNLTTAGDIYITGVQVSDYDSDYFPTSGAAASTTAQGARFQHGIIVNGTVITNGGAQLNNISQSGAALCQKADKTIGYCSTVVAAGGTCTCN